MKFQAELAAWYHANHRKLPWRKSQNPYHIWISEVMLQQTQVTTVIPYFLKFIDRFPHLENLARADLETVLKMWEGLGYYARARNLHKAVQIVENEWNGIVPDHIETFRHLPGVGDYIASAVQSIAFDHPLAVADGNVKRVLSRLFKLKHPANHASSHKKFKSFADKILNKKEPGLHNQAMMELGALVCIPGTPACSSCPVTGFCSAFLSGSTASYPVRISRKKTPTYQIAVGVIRKNGKLLITRRKLDGLLGGLWEFPGGKLRPDETAPSACIREIKEETGITVRVSSQLTTVQHAFTHFKIIMDVFFCDYVSGRICLNGPIDHKWIRPGDIDQFAFPKANLKFAHLIKEEQ